MYWTSHAADKGNERAGQRLKYLPGKDYHGEAVDKHDDYYYAAVYWYEKAARQGHANAMVYLGYMHEYGIGLKQDDAEAIRW